MKDEKNVAIMNEMGSARQQKKNNGQLWKKKEKQDQRETEEGEKKWNWPEPK